MDIRRQPAAERAKVLATRLREASRELVAVIARIEDRDWMSVSEPGVWSIGKEVDHVAEAAAYHQWIVRLTIGERVSARRPVLERRQMTSDLSPRQAADLLRQRTDDGVRLIGALNDDQLDLPTRPARANDPILADTIAAVLISHIDGHRADILVKLEALGKA
jgi:hypothetical protein